MGRKINFFRVQLWQTESQNRRTFLNTSKVEEHAGEAMTQVSFIGDPPSHPIEEEKICVHAFYVEERAEEKYREIVETMTRTVRKVRYELECRIGDVNGWNSRRDSY